MASVDNGDFMEEDLEEIRSLILKKQNVSGYIKDCDLFIDEAFPPDISSLTYIYSGDDKYERMQFKRPRVSTIGGLRLI